MTLSEALRITPNSIITFTGAGGKTTAMLRLGKELTTAGYRVIATTTTRLGLNQLDLFPAYLVSPTTSEIKKALAKHSLVLVVKETCQVFGDLTGLADGKALGFPPDAIADFLEFADVVLVEGDGSKQLPLKAPGPHEPVIPPQTTHVITLLGLWGLGQPFGPAIVHRPDHFARLTGLAAGSLITTASLARLLLHPAGLARGAPNGAERYVLLNGADQMIQDSRLKIRADAADGNSIVNHQSLILNLASRLAAAPQFTAIILGQMAHEPPVLASYGKTAAIVLAGGGSSRFGSPKQLHRWQDGEPLLRHVVLQALAAPVQEVIVVLGAYFAEIAPLLHGLPVTLAYSSDWATGQSASMQVGLRSCAADTQAALFILGDQPHLPADLLRHLLDTHRRTLAPIVAPRHQGRRGNPVLFDRVCFPELLEISGDTGGRPLFRRYADDVEWIESAEGVLIDIDLPPERN